MFCSAGNVWGDLGGAFGPSLIGNITQNSNDNFAKLGCFAGCIFPLVLIISLIAVKLTWQK